MGSNLNFISEEEAEALNDEYTQVLEQIFGRTNSEFVKLGVKNTLERLGSHVFPVPTLSDFIWFLRSTRPVGICDGVDVITIGRKFRLDDFTHFDWITCDFEPLIPERELRDDCFGFVTRFTLYKLLRYGWDKHEFNSKSG